MLPVVAIIGRPNVGKSTLFNRLTSSRDAIVDDQPGVTRDRLYGKAVISKQPCWVVDSGGINFDDGYFEQQIQSQLELLLAEADEIFFIVDGRAGIQSGDELLATFLRKTSLPIHLLVNKSEGQEKQQIIADFQGLGLGQPTAISASRGDGVKNLLNLVLSKHTIIDVPVDDGMPRVAVIGQPNAGKSTLVNALLGEKRIIVSHLPGTTRDSVTVELTHKGVSYLVTDTAGVRRKSRVDETLEKFSVIKTLQAIEQCNVAILMLDASAGIRAQDMTIANMIKKMGRAMVVAVNKWDSLSRADQTHLMGEFDRNFYNMPHIESLPISAKFGTALGKLLPMVKRAYDSTFYNFNTSQLNRFVERAIEHTPPPMKQGRRIKIKFAHQAGKNPPVIVIHGNQVDQLPATYWRYLQGSLAKSYGLVGIAIRLIPRVEENPYAHLAQKREGRKSKSGANARRRKRQ